VRGGGGNELGRGIEAGRSDKMHRKNRKKVTEGIHEMAE
jgi:hypothetical protein